MPGLLCAHPRCDNLVLPPRKRWCSSQCCDRARALAYYHRQSPERKKEIYEKEKPGSAAKQARYRARHPEVLASRSWRDKGINITYPQYEALYIAQGGRCALCSEEKPMGKREGLHVDHCHETGVIRGLLCFRCNTALGGLGDTPEALERVMEYVCREPPALA